ncbi:unnamed protein product [Staurois parvus]|uniref:Uncharacterized protein n=1 Tax=Staurois parvus TaxID=386267 RepID=A0ABN9CCY5_9NEOB|nr:unnamed protein product [Staurois parvus]
MFVVSEHLLLYLCSFQPSLVACLQSLTISCYMFAVSDHSLLHVCSLLPYRIACL